MKLYVIAEPGFGTRVEAGRTILAFRNDGEVTEAARKYGTELTEEQYRAIFYEQYHCDADNYLRHLRGEFKFRVIVIRVEAPDDEAYTRTVFCAPISDILPIMRDGVTQLQLEIECGFRQTDFGNSVMLSRLANRPELFRYRKDYDSVRQAADFLNKLGYSDLTGIESTYFPKTNCLVKRSQRVMDEFNMRVHERTERNNRRKMVLLHIFYRRFVRFAVKHGTMPKIKTQLRPMTDSRLLKWFESVKDELTGFAEYELDVFDDYTDDNKHQFFRVILN